MASSIFAIPIKRLEPAASEQLSLFNDFHFLRGFQDGLEQFIFGQENAPVRQALECVLAQQTM